MWRRPPPNDARCPCKSYRINRRRFTRPSTSSASAKLAIGMREKQNSDTGEPVDQLVRLTSNQCNWSFYLCYLYLCNIKVWLEPQANLSDLLAQSVSQRRLHKARKPKRC